MKLVKRLTIVFGVTLLLLASFLFALNVFTPYRWYAQSQLAAVVSPLLVMAAVAIPTWVYGLSKGLVISRSPQLRRIDLDQRFQLWQLFAAMTFAGFFLTASQYVVANTDLKEGLEVFWTDFTVLAPFVVVVAAMSLTITGFVFLGKKNALPAYSLIAILGLGPIFIESVVSMFLKDNEISIFGSVRHEIISGIDIHFVANSFLFFATIAASMIIVLNCYKALGCKLVKLSR